MSSSYNWDRRWLETARHFSTFSKDPSTKVGAIAVNPVDQQLLSIGWNGFPRGVLDSQERLNDRETKLKYVVHAELNCLLNAARNGIRLLGTTMYIWGLPVCGECAGDIVQAGVKTVFSSYDLVKAERWKESCDFADVLLREAGVSYFRFQ